MEGGDAGGKRDIENLESRFADIERREGCGWNVGARAARPQGRQPGIRVFNAEKTEGRRRGEGRKEGRRKGKNARKVKENLKSHDMG